MADPIAHAGLVAEAVKPVLRQRGCDLLLVHGDTSSALGGALGGFEADIPVGHVEAGLRSFDSANPWPEEDNRVTIDACASLLLAPTDTSAANLAAKTSPARSMSPATRPSTPCLDRSALCLRFLSSRRAPRLCWSPVTGARTGAPT